MNAVRCLFRTCQFAVLVAGTAAAAETTPVQIDQTVEPRFPVALTTFSSTLALAPMSADLAGSYSVEITNASGSVESASATITLAPSPVAPSSAIITITVE